MTDTVQFNELIEDAVGTAFDEAQFITVAYTGDDGWPQVSRRGSTHVYGPGQIAIWVRKRDDGLAKAIERDSKVTLFYIDMAKRFQLLTFYGQAHVSNDQAVSDKVWENTPEREKAQDPEHKGIPLIIDVERVVAQGGKPEQNFVLG